MSNKVEAALHGRTLQDELRAATQESDDYSLLTRAASALDAAEAPGLPQFKLLGAEEALAALGMGLPAQYVEVHHHDIEKHAESFNEGYDAAMAHQLMSDDELEHKSPEDWLEEKHQAWDDGHHAGVLDATSDEPGTYDNPHSADPKH